MAISVSKLIRPDPTNQSVSIYLGEEEELYPSFKRHYESSKVLINMVSPGDKQLAVYSLYIAMECLLKEIYCILRAHHGFTSDFAKLIMRMKTLGVKELKNADPTKIFGVRAFSHDLRNIGAVLKQEITELQKSTDWDTIVQAFPDKGWVEKRYFDMVEPNPEQKFNIITQTLSILAKNELKTLINVGDI